MYFLFITTNTSTPIDILRYKTYEAAYKDMKKFYESINNGHSVNFINDSCVEVLDADGITHKYEIISEQDLLGVELPLTRSEIVQYCLNEGTGIEYTPSPKNETTLKELREATRHGRKPRCVASETVNFFVDHPHQEQVRYAINHDISLLDFDEWQAIQNVLGVMVPYETALKVNNALYEDMDISPLDLE